MKTTRPSAYQKRTLSGFTLVELVITIAVMAIALLGVAYSLQFSAKFGADALWQTKTVELVQVYADEIATKRYDENTPIGGIPACTAATCTAQGSFGPDSESRGSGVNTFDDVDDYHGLNETPIDAQGDARLEYTGYNVTVSVAYIGTQLGLSNNVFAKEVTITVTPPGQQPVPFTLYRGDF